MEHNKTYIWSAGDRTGKQEKIKIIFLAVCIVLDFAAITAPCITANLIVSEDPPMSVLESLFLSLFLFVVLGWVIPVLMFGINYSIKNIKNNKLIPLYIYTIDEFAAIGRVPDNKFVVFSDAQGVVLGLKKYEDETKNACEWIKYFREFESFIKG